MDRIQPRFSRGEFHDELRRRVERHFRAAGVSERDRPAMYLKTAVILTWFAGSYALLLFGVRAWWQAVPAAISLGLALAGIGFNIGHDGGHGSYSRRRGLNLATALSFDFMGASSYVWAWKHNVVHHSYPNIHGFDDDIDVGGLARLAPAQRRRWFHRFQHLYMWFFLGLLPLKWYFIDDFRALLTARVANQRLPRTRRGDLALLVAGKLTFLAWGFALPLLLGHRPWAVVAIYFLTAFVMGVTLGVVFQLAHCVGEARFPVRPAATGQMATEWAVHQVETSVDFARGNRLVSWYMGGLNFQIEHHLFPRICHVHYPTLAPIVESACEELGVRYQAHSSLTGAIGSHFRWLRAMGRPAVAVT